MKNSVPAILVLAGCAGVAGFVIGRMTERRMPAPAVATVPVVESPQIRAMVISAEATVDSAESTLQTLRSQLLLYKVQHGDHFPKMAQMSDWGAVLQKTDHEGNVSPSGEFGPYIQKAPVNPLRQNAKVRALDSPSTDAGWTWDEKRGVLRLLVTAQEMEIFKGLPAGDVDIVSTREALESPEAKFSSLASTRQTVRSQLELYKIQHGGRAITVAQLANWGITLHVSGSDGKAYSGSGESFGPYLQEAPVNPFTQQSKVVAAGSATKDAGWTWDETRQILRAVIPAREMAYLSGVKREDVEVVK